MDVNFILFRYDTSDLQIVSGSVKACELQYPISDNLISTQIKSLSDEVDMGSLGVVCLSQKNINLGLGCSSMVAGMHLNDRVLAPHVRYSEIDIYH